MSCQEVQKFIHPYLDGEIDEREWVALAAHIENCNNCQRLVQFEQTFRQSLKKSLKLTSAPPSLSVKLKNALDEIDEAESWSHRWLWRLIPAAAAILVVVGVFLSKSQEFSPLSTLAEDSIAWHRRHMPMDVSGSSLEQVQQFFSDKVPFAVRPPTFSSPKAKLVGARLSNLGEHQAVFLTYHVAGNRVSVFIFDPQVMHDLRGATRVGKRDVYWRDVRGYNVALFTAGGTGYAVTSDMEPQRLVQLIAHAGN